MTRQHVRSAKPRRKRFIIVKTGNKDEVAKSFDLVDYCYGGGQGISIDLVIKVKMFIREKSGASRTLKSVP